MRKERYSNYCKIKEEGPIFAEYPTDHAPVGGSRRCSARSACSWTTSKTLRTPIERAPPCAASAGPLVIRTTVSNYPAHRIDKQPSLVRAATCVNKSRYPTHLFVSFRQSRDKPLPKRVRVGHPLSRWCCQIGRPCCACACRSNSVCPGAKISTTIAATGHIPLDARRVECLSPVASFTQESPHQRPCRRSRHLDLMIVNRT
jgi:hypothetical protein